MFDLQRLRADHEGAVLAFERDNRSYFALFISDRGDRYFDEFEDRHTRELAEQACGASAYYVLVDADGAVVGRFNLRNIDDRSALLGYRVAQHVAGRGVATRTVGQLCRKAAAELGVATVRAATSNANLASQRVLLKAGFVLMGPAEPEDVGGRAGSWYAWQAPPS